MASLHISPAPQDVNMNVIQCNNLTYDFTTMRYVKRVAPLRLPSSVDEVVDPYIPRRYFWEAFPDNHRVTLVRVRINNMGAMQELKEEAIIAGNLQQAYRIHSQMGAGDLTAREMQLYPWWDTYYCEMIDRQCVRCDAHLYEDRAMSADCHHELCTSCACEVTSLEAYSVRCPACQVATRFQIYNGEQSDDDRTHFDVVIFL